MKHGVTYDIELQAGQALSLPRSIVDQVGPGHWRVTIEPVDDENAVRVRNWSMGSALRGRILLPDHIFELIVRRC